MRILLSVVLSSVSLLFAQAASPEKFVPAQYDPFVGDWLPKNPGDYVAQVFATGSNAYQANVLVAFDDESGFAPVATLRGARPEEKSPVTLRDTSGEWTGEIRPDCCGSPQMEIASSKTGEKVRLAQYMRPNPRLRAKPPEGAVALFGERMRDGVVMLSAGDGTLVLSEHFENARAHLEFRMLGEKSAGVLTMWKNKTLELQSSYGRDGVILCGSLDGLLPLARAERALLEWQALDVEMRDGRLTIYLNGVKLHDNAAKSPASTDRAPLKIEPRGEPVELRNLWVHRLGNNNESR